ncbi:MAG: hypothetical protein BRD23_01000 [Halobacteriales archaeon SW_9_67_25]|nr:MAG: hypothetical protein BRD23_01000 [Halobacteriales archaeon SW_9_67_25]
MTEELPVHVSRTELHSLDVPASTEAHGPFDVVFVNHAEAVHVHLHLDDTLSEVAAIEASNHYIDGESRRAVRVHVDEAALPEEAVIGKLKIASGYGARTRWVDVELSAPPEEESAVEVDESLARPPAPEPDESGSPLLARPELPVLALGAVALAVALAATLVLDQTAVLVGALAVLGGVLVALFLLLGG